MVHKSSFIPGLSKFIDEAVLSHYPPSSMKRIIMAGAISLYLKKNDGFIDTIMSNPLISSLGVVSADGKVDIETLHVALKSEVKKAGFMRLSVPFVGNIDFTPEDVDILYKYIVEADSTTMLPATTPQFNSNMNGGIY